MKKETKELSFTTVLIAGTLMFIFSLICDSLITFLVGMVTIGWASRKIGLF